MDASTASKSSSDRPIAPGAAPASSRWETTSDPANLAPLRKSVEAFCLMHGLGQPGADDVGLCLNEAMANVTRHAYAGRTDQPVVVTVHNSPTAITLTIRDWGNGVDPDLGAAKPRDPLVPGGLGLICMRKLLDDARFDPQPDGMMLTMVKNKPTGAAGDETATTKK
jgi:anti-sigma regulatory factor (Ser/Thr protein kinase)